MIETMTVDADRMHFIVLGAGASFGARADCGERPRPPLGKMLATYLRVWFEANRGSGVDRAFRNSERPDTELFEDERFNLDLIAFLTRIEAARGDFERGMDHLIDEWSDRRNDLRKINRVFAYAMLLGRKCAFEPEADLYDRFLKSIHHPRTKIIVVSFNYDILFEEAAARHLGCPDNVTGAVLYPGLRVQEPEAAVRRLRVLKPHGSINWFRVDTHLARSHDPERARAEIKPASIVAGRPAALDTGSEYVPPGTHANLVLQLQHDPRKYPILAFYSPGKPVADNPRAIQKVREQCISTLREAPDADVTAVGIRPPCKDEEDDEFLEELFEAARHCSGEKRYVSPQPAECLRAQSYGFAAKQQTFADFVTGLQRSAG
jgi:hypothetical protein